VNFIVGGLNAGLGTILTKSNTTGDRATILTKAYTATAAKRRHARTELHVVPWRSARRLGPDPSQVPNIRDSVVADGGAHPERAMLDAFIDDGATSSVHVAYAERVGRYVPGSPGFYPMTLPVRITCAAIVRGVLVLGTTDGRLVAFDTDATTDLGSAMTSKLTTARTLRRYRGRHDHPASMPCATTARNSPNFYGAVSPESAYTGTRRLLATLR
jgi:hypothetical protein